MDSGPWDTAVLLPAKSLNILATCVNFICQVAFTVNSACWNHALKKLNKCQTKGQTWPLFSRNSQPFPILPLLVPASLLPALTIYMWGSLYYYLAHLCTVNKYLLNWMETHRIESEMTWLVTSDMQTYVVIPHNLLLLDGLQQGTSYAFFLHRTWVPLKKEFT